MEDKNVSVPHGFQPVYVRVKGKRIYPKPIRIGPGKIIEVEDISDSPIPLSEEFYGYVPNYPPPLDTNPFNLIEGNENKSY